MATLRRPSERYGRRLATRTKHRTMRRSKVLASCHPPPLASRSDWRLVAKRKQSSDSLHVAVRAEDKVRYEAELKEYKAQMEKKNAEKLEQEVSDA